jgi:hypothetical protein
MAGMNRLHLRATHTVAFPVDVIVPAVGQGALAVETRRGDPFLSGEIEAAVNDGTSALCIRCERAVLRALRAGCSAPIGIYASAENGRLAVEVAYAAGDAGPVQRLRHERACPTVEEAEAFGTDIAAALAAGKSRRVVLPRTVARPSRIAALLRASGVEVVELAVGDDGPDPAEGRVDMVLFPSSGAVAAAVAFLKRLDGRDPRPVVIAMGPASASAARAAGFEPDAVAPEASVEAFVALARERLERRL